MSPRNPGGWAVVDLNTGKVWSIDFTRAEAYESRAAAEYCFEGRFVVRKQ